MAEQGSYIGRTIGRYKISERLGRGGMAEVYKGYLEALDRVVAIKIMHPFLSAEPGFLGRFQREARAMAALNHPNIVSVYDFDVQGDTYYIVMEFVGGGTLRDKLEELARRGERMTVAAAVRLVLEVADALAYAHARGTFHRDVKPGNIMLREDGSAVLTDFGIARNLSGPSYTMTGAMLGTPAYMSPEQGLGQTGDERSDLYALGVLFFQMVTGRLPFDADTPLAVVIKHVQEPVPLPIHFNSQIPDDIQQVILRAMAKEPAARFQSAHEMGKALRAILAQSHNRHLAAALPTDLLRQRPTPLPLAGRQPPIAPPGATLVSPVPAGLGVPTASRPQAGPTVASGQTAVAVPAVARPSSPTLPSPSKRRVWFWLAGAAGILLFFSLLGATIILASRRRPQPTPVASGAVTAATINPASPSA
ncbi:MAG: protein kinase, partial [Chloroflexota bacterium]